MFHRNPWYFRAGKTWLDSGAFTLALETATQRQAVVTGKPSPVLFNSALASMGLDKSQALMVDDDVTTDIVGARAIGLPTLLVGSGKFRPDDLVRHALILRLPRMESYFTAAMRFFVKTARRFITSPPLRIARSGPALPACGF
ncbi:HAD hydrolase-like protein [Mixta calida]|uniref:HAD hydrolase-like protein n=1 Tax=Mixta calida TaxID=665913 RepID=UPI002908CD11|nr:HAD hydrolase-like protein [Mixta calida]MDU6414261.1 HAD hydrolase-like protein [Mixta calida]